MATLNGVGTKFNGFTNPGPDGTCTVTLWFTLLYFPIFPLYAMRIKRTATSLQDLGYLPLGRVNLNGKEILATYFYGWIVTPVLWFWPIPFAVREVGEKLGYTNEKAEGVFYNSLIGFAILYLVVFAWKWKDWDEKRWLSETGKSRH